MFSFFKFLQNFLKDLKKKKGLWFTILAVVSISGIFLSLYILTSLTNNVSQDVYNNISTNYVKNYKNRVLKKEDSFQKILMTLKTNKVLIEDIVNNELTAVTDEVNLFNENFKKSGFESLNLNFYPVLNQVSQYRNSVNSVIATKSKAFGLEVLQDGVFYVYLEPILADDTLVGILELKEEINSFKKEYLRDDLIFLFALEERMLNKLSIKARNGKYKELVDTLHVEELKFDGQFTAKILEAGKDDFKNMLDKGYSVGDTYFRSAQKVSDINGNVIGVIVFGETVAGSDAFVNIVHNMTKTVTTVALGLVISILLFMF
ncbi:MAG: hypothetical protein CL623_09885 [Arcobacter sp.]|nr:hypothetical protein [Arcobacter sp.]|tara:strand:+ start:12544 stop:13497 length:954 start_codon:yes stop_codon:yes gene_type:complete